MGCLFSQSDNVEENRNKVKPVASPVKTSTLTSGIQANSGANHNKAVSVSDIGAAPVAITWKSVHSSSRWNKLPELISQLESNPDLIMSKDDKNGNTPIHIAAQNGHIEVVKYLIEKKAILDIQNNKGNTPLHMAIGYDYYDVAKALIAAGSSLDITNTAGFRAELGIDGDKSLPLSALISAERTANVKDAKEALNLCAENTRLLHSVSFAGTGLKVKKAMGESWTPELQDQFKSILNQLD